MALHHVGWQDSSGNATNEGIRLQAIVDFLVGANESEPSSLLTELTACISDSDAITTSTGKAVVNKAVPLPKPQQAMADRSVTLNLGDAVQKLRIIFN